MWLCSSNHWWVMCLSVHLHVCQQSFNCCGFTGWPSSSLWPYWWLSWLLLPFASFTITRSKYSSDCRRAPTNSVMLGSVYWKGKKWKIGRICYLILFGSRKIGDKFISWWISLLVHIATTVSFDGPMNCYQVVSNWVVVHKQNSYKIAGKFYFYSEW